MFNLFKKKKNNTFIMVCTDGYTNYVFNKTNNKFYVSYGFNENDITKINEVSILYVASALSCQEYIDFKTLPLCEQLKPLILGYKKERKIYNFKYELLKLVWNHNYKVTKWNVTPNNKLLEIQTDTSKKYYIKFLDKYVELSKRL